MPTYEYRCTQCKHTMEEFQSMKDDALVDCPVCHTPNLVRVIGNGSGLIFKGKGFYQTDYKKSGTATSSSGTQKPNTEPAKSDAPAADTSKTESSAGSSAKSSDTGGGEKSQPAAGSAPKSE